MTDKSIKKYIDRLNKGQGQKTIFSKHLSENIEVAKVLSKQPSKKSISPPFEHKLYFIKNSSGVYVGAVNDGGSDLHWYVNPKNRKKGHLTKALKNTILPHIFKEKKSQLITISKGILYYENSLSVALAIGFTKTDENKYITHLELNSTDLNK